MAAERVLFFGLGFSAQETLNELAKQKEKWTVAGTCRTEEKQRKMKEEHKDTLDEMFVWDSSSSLPPSSEPSDVFLTAEHVQSFHHVVISVPPLADGSCPVLKTWGEALSSSPHLLSVLYLSTTGAYGDHQGQWVSESDSLPSLSLIHERGSGRLKAESEWLKWTTETPDKKVFALRLSGIYGKGQSYLDQLRNPNPLRPLFRVLKPNQIFNRIHVSDIATVISHILNLLSSTSSFVFPPSDVPLPSGEKGGYYVYNVSDSEPEEQKVVVEFAAQLLERDPPEEVEWEEAKKNMSPMALGFWSSSRRVSNRKIIEQLKYSFVFPTYREGFRALL